MKWVNIGDVEEFNLFSNAVTFKNAATQYTNTGNYVKVSTNASSKVVTVAEHVVTLANATASNTGIADANDVKTYIDTYDFWETYSPQA